ncbi:MAG: DEAD/DEAH box helicase family protein [Fimbriimonadales bacterium]
MSDPSHESERITRRKRIDPKLTSQGWQVTEFETSRNLGLLNGVAVAEWPTDNGPADYALCQGGQVIAVVEAKRVTVGPQNVLTQAARYSQGVRETVAKYGEGFKVPFLYSTNGEIIWFQDVQDPLHRSRKVAAFHTPQALIDMLGRNDQELLARLHSQPFREGSVRPYQEDAIRAVEAAIRDRKRQMMVVMATGTGKTRTTIQQAYRLMKSGAAKRVLFLVDRRALAAQTVRAFASFECEPGLKFDKVYEVYSQRFQQADLDDDSGEKFDPKVLPNRYLTDPQAGDAFVYVSTIQRMAINLYGRQGMLEGLGESEDDAEQLNIPIHSFDLIIADECHRGYSRKEEAIWRDTLDHFDATKVGLTATPAAHTVAYFGDPVYRYGYKQAVDEGYLVDYDVVNVRSDVRIEGVTLKEGERIEVVDTHEGTTKNIDYLEDEVVYDASAIEAKITSPDSNRKIVAELKKHALAHEAEYGRFPKTLIFAANDLQHTSHANQLVSLCREIFGRGDGFVSKITGAKDVDRPLQRIKEFRNRPEPKIVVTVDLLTTGVDVPQIEFLVFLRPVKSRILFEQMLGRGTRLCDTFEGPAKSHFVVFDCFDGSLIASFRQASTMAVEAPISDPIPLEEVIDNIWNNERRDYHVKVLTKRLRRIDKEITGDGRVKFLEFTNSLDLSDFADQLNSLLKAKFTGTMGLLKNEEFQQFLNSYPRPNREFVIATGFQDTVSSERLIRYKDQDLRPDDYLAEFSRFVEANRNQIEALSILLEKPQGWSTEALRELRTALRQAQFPEERVREAITIARHKALADVISMVKNAADGARPLLTAEERVNTALSQVTGGMELTPEQHGWLELIRQRLVADLAIEPDDFELHPLDEQGGFAKANRVFGGGLRDLLNQINWAIAQAA